MRIERFLKIPLLAELLLMVGFLVVINNFIGNVEKHISGDGVGYYEYLPSAFIRHDLVRVTQTMPLSKGTQKHFDNTGVYVDFEGRKVNKYPVGTSLLEAPFFAVAYLFTEDKAQSTGYEPIYHKAVFYAALFYLFLGLVFAKLLLRSFGVDEWTNFICQALLVFATTLSHYANFDAGYSHVFSFFAITLFAYLAKSFFATQRLRFFLLAAATFGLIFLLRNPNILILFLVPFLAGSWSQLKGGLFTLWRHKVWLILGLLICGLVAGIQFLFWFMQTGYFLVYSYQGEGFDFANPEIVNVLFSYRKGLFVYTPVLFIGLLSTLYWLFQKQWYAFMTWWGFFALITFIISSWWTWVYGCSFGMRPYVDFYILFFIPLGVFLSNLKSFWKWSSIAICALCIPLNLIQTYQYKAFILDWINMNETKYWNVFLETDDKFKNIWAGELVEDQYETLCMFSTQETTVPKLESRQIGEWSADELAACAGFKVVRIRYATIFTRHAIDKILVELEDDSGSLYWEARPIQHFAKQAFGVEHEGFFNFILPNYDAASVKLKIHAMNGFEAKQYTPMQVELLKGKWD